MCFGQKKIVLGASKKHLSDISFDLTAKNILPSRDKTCLRGFRQSDTQTSLLSYRD